MTVEVGYPGLYLKYQCSTKKKVRQFIICVKNTKKDNEFFFYKDGMSSYPFRDRNEYIQFNIQDKYVRVQYFDNYQLKNKMLSGQSEDLKTRKNLCDKEQYSCEIYFENDNYPDILYINRFYDGMTIENKLIDNYYRGECSIDVYKITFFYKNKELFNFKKLNKCQAISCYDCDDFGSSSSFEFCHINDIKILDTKVTGISYENDRITLCYKGIEQIYKVEDFLL